MQRGNVVWKKKYVFVVAVKELFVIVKANADCLEPRALLMSLLFID